MMKDRRSFREVETRDAREMIFHLCHIMVRSGLLFSVHKPEGVVSGTFRANKERINKWIYSINFRSLLDVTQFSTTLSLSQ